MGHSGLSSIPGLAGGLLGGLRSGSSIMYSSLAPREGKGGVRMDRRFWMDFSGRFRDFTACFGLFLISWQWVGPGGSFSTSVDTLCTCLVLAPPRGEGPPGKWG